MKQLVTFKEAREMVLKRMTLMPEAEVSLADALGRTLAHSVVSRDEIPPFANSAMDGFAVRAADIQEVPTDLSVIDEIVAGAMPKRTIGPGQCARIMTGAAVPDGADAVIPVEWTAESGHDSVEIQRTAEAGRHVRAKAEDVRIGEVVFDPGTVITPPVVGMLSSLGFAAVPVRRRPRVAIIATGSELVDAHETPGPGQIRNSNGPALSAQVIVAGGVPLVQASAGDNRTEIEAVVSGALATDMLVISGGVSVGKHDLVREVLDSLGLDLAFWRVRQRPGKPLAFGTIHGLPVFGLPGNPVSSSVCFEQYVRPAIATMLGRKEVVPTLLPATLEGTIRKVAGLHYFSRGTCRFGENGHLLVRSAGLQGSNIYSSMVRANCLIHLDEDGVDPQDGTQVFIEMMGWNAARYGQR